MGPKTDIKDFNPFPGLRPYAPEDSNLFFGRQSESKEVISRLLKNRFITIVGAAGNGKSSLIFSGVLPQIIKTKTGDSPVWRTITFSPGNDPFGNLALSLSNGISDSGYNDIGRDTILSELRTSPVCFTDIIRKFMINSKDNILLIIDQFEELFRYSVSKKSEGIQETVKSFIDFVVASVKRTDTNIFIIITLRSEYLGECSHYKDFTLLLNESNYLVPMLQPASLKEIIEGPVIYAGAGIEPELVGIIIDDLKRSDEQLPVLQHTLMRTWAHWQELGQKDKPLGRSDYHMTGGMENALSLHAEEVYDDLSPRGKDICALMFRSITRKSSDKKGLRHPLDIETIKSIAGCSVEELFDVIDKFRSPSGCFITPSRNVILSSSSVIDLQTECLIRLWERLKEWVDAEAISTDIYLRVSEASALYQQGKAGLLRSPDLLTAIAWRDREKPSLAWAIQYNPAFERTIVYLRTSERAYHEEEQNKITLQKRKLRRTRLLTRMLGVTLLLATGLMLLSYYQKLNVQKKIVLSEKQRLQITREKTLADSVAAIAFSQKISADMATEDAIRSAEEAKQQKIIADVQKSYAERKAQEAHRQKNLAVEQSNVSQRMRMLSLGKSMSLKSLQLTGQKDLQALVAYQAYVFNKRNSGPDNDADIYDGLYNIALQYGNNNYRSFRGHNGDIKSIAFIPGKNEFFTAGNDGQVLKWSLDKKDQTLQVMYSGNDIIEVLAVSPDASWLACGYSNSSIRMIPLKGNNISYEMSGHTGGIKSLIFSYDGKYLYSAALDGKVLKWDIATRTNVNVTTGEMEISSIDVSSRGNYIAGIGIDGNVVVWDPEKKDGNFRIETAGRNIRVVKFDPEKNLLALGDAEGMVELWDIESRRKLAEVKAHDSQINDIEFNASLRQMATAGNDKKLKIFNIKDPANLTEPPVTLSDNEGFVLVMQFSPDGQMIVSGEGAGNNNLIGRPSHADYIADDICGVLSRNMTQEEWNIYVGKDIPLEKTCQIKSYNIKVEPIKSNNK